MVITTGTARMPVESLGGAGPIEERSEISFSESGVASSLGRLEETVADAGAPSRAPHVPIPFPDRPGESDTEDVEPPARSWRLAIAAPALLVAARAGLAMASLDATREWVRELVASWTWLLPRIMERPDRIGDRIRKTGSRMGLITSCLTEAIVTEALVRSSGERARLCIGVARCRTGGIDAHAWVECRKNVIIGDLPDLARYRPLGSAAPHSFCEDLHAQN